MAKHIQHLSQPIKGYIHKNEDNLTLKKHALSNNRHNKNSTLPPALKLGIIKGQAHADLACFAFFRGKNFDDAFIYEAYQKIYQDSNAIIDFVQHCGLIKHTEDYITQGIATQTADYNKLCKELFYLLINHLYENDEHKLFRSTTTGFIQHYFPSFYPKKSNIKTSLEQLQKQLTIVINKKLHAKAVIKESFTTDETVTFKLMVYVQGYHAYELINITASRVRSARFQAYHTALENMQDTSQTILLQPKTVKKHKPSIPLN